MGHVACVHQSSEGKTSTRAGPPLALVRRSRGAVSNAGLLCTVARCNPTPLGHTRPLPIGGTGRSRRCGTPSHARWTVSNVGPGVRSRHHSHAHAAHLGETEEPVESKWMVPTLSPGSALIAHQPKPRRCCALSSSGRCRHTATPRTRIGASRRHPAHASRPPGGAAPLDRREPGMWEREGETTAFEWSLPRWGAGA